MSALGLYEQLINKVVHAKLSALDKDKFYIKEDVLDRVEAAQYLSAYLSDIIRLALSSFSADDGIDKQIELSEVGRFSRTLVIESFD